MTAYHDANTDDAADAAAKSARVQVPWNKNDVGFWFFTMESQMRFAGVGTQYLKLQILTSNLPEHVIEEIKPLLRITEENDTSRCYADAKKRILELFGPKESERYAKAAELVLITTPSALCKKMIDIICDKYPPLQGCCCPALVSGMWRSKLPVNVRNAVADMDIGGGNLDATLRKADAVFASDQGTTKLNAYTKSNGGRGAAGSASRGRGASGRGYRGRGGQSRGGATGGQQNQQGANKMDKSNWGPKHADGPPDTVCAHHWKHGKSAYFCKRPHSCPWVQFTVPAPDK